MASTQHPQLSKLNTLIAEAIHASRAASNGVLFQSLSGARLINAMHDLTQVDGLYDLAGDVAHDCGYDRDCRTRLGDDGEPVVDRSSEADRRAYQAMVL